MSRILLIDDDRLLLTALPAVFEGSPCVITVDTASSAEQALRLIEATEYDTIVSDFSMPGLNGIEFLKECKAVRPDIPIILLTGYGTLELEEKAFEEGAYAVIQKPVDPDVFLSVVTRAMIRREVRRLGPTPKSATSTDAQMFAMENKRLSSRLRDIDERLRRQSEKMWKRYNSIEEKDLLNAVATLNTYPSNYTVITPDHFCLAVASVSA
jgi:two-component system, NtrC family, nitrogen regulation response regulator NtrX